MDGILMSTVYMIKVLAFGVLATYNFPKNLVALDQANSNLSEKTWRLSKLEFELDQSKLGCERLEKIKCDLEAELKNYCDERVLIKKDLEDALLVKVEAEKKLMDRNEAFVQIIKEKDEKIGHLQQQIVLIEEDKRMFDVFCQAKLDYEKLIEMETKKVNQFVDDVDKKLMYSQAEVEFVVLNYVLNVIDLVIKLEEERLMFEQVQEKKEKVIFDMDQKSKSHEQELFAASIKQKEAQIEICALNNALEKTVETHVIDKFDNHYQHIINAELEEEINRLMLKAEKDEMLSVEILTILEEENLMLDQKCMSNEQDCSKYEEIAASIKDAQMELYPLHEALENILAGYVLHKQEIYYKDILLAELDKEFDYLERKAEEDQIRTSETEKRRLMILQVIEEKENVIANMRQKILCYEHEITSAYILYQHEIYYKNILVTELEDEIQHLQMKFKSEEDISHGLKNSVNEFEVKLANVLLEKENEHRTLLCQISSLETHSNMLKSEKQSVCKLIKKLSSDNENATNNLRSFGNMIEDIYDRSEDIKEKWNKVLQITAHDEVALTNIEADELLGSKKIYSKVLDSPSRNRRSPLKEHNC